MLALFLAVPKPGVCFSKYAATLIMSSSVIIPAKAPMMALGRSLPAL